MITPVTVDKLGEAERGSVWRCYDCTVAWIAGAKSVATRTGRTSVAAWCRLDGMEWIPLGRMPAGPFFRIDNPVFDDFRYPGGAPSVIGRHRDE